MDLTNVLLVIQLISTGVFSLIAWALKGVIASNIEPIKNDISGMRKDMNEMNLFWKEHRTDLHPHPTYEDSADDTYVSKEQLQEILKRLEDKIEWKLKQNGN